MPGSAHTGVVGVGLQVVVCGELAYVAAIACGVEGVDRFLPMDRLVRKVADAARRGVKPLLLLHIVGQRQGLQTSPVERGEKIVDVLPAQHMLDLVLLALRWTSPSQQRNRCYR